tara:strand:- start:14132 stop:14284 length:153 start_codon:yes stop_codon:yes gene_type:complete
MTTAGTPDGFNPRAREGRDMTNENQVTQQQRFNPRAREGRDLIGTRQSVT